MGVPLLDEFAQDDVRRHDRQGADPLVFLPKNADHVKVDDNWPALWAKGQVDLRAA